MNERIDSKYHFTVDSKDFSFCFFILPSISCYKARQRTDEMTNMQLERKNGRLFTLKTYLYYYIKGYLFFQQLKKGSKR